MKDNITQYVKGNLANKQRDALISERGDPILKLDFDVFEGNKVSMWTHFNHAVDFTKTKEQLIAIRNHLNEFLRDENMCPFHQPVKQPKNDVNIEQVSIYTENK